MGTPEFAVPSLEILIAHGYNIVAVITSVDKYGGRGKKKLIESAIKKSAQKHQIDILQPKNLKSPQFVDLLKSYNADLQIVVAFRMLPEVVWNMPPLGSYNLHGSLLPKYRGAAPINWAVIQGEEVTGVTSFKLKHQIDTGDMLLQKRMAIYPDDTAGDVHDRMMWLAASAVLETVQRIENEDIALIQQDPKQISKAPKINKEVCEIDFNQPAKRVNDFIRGMSPYPAAWMKLDKLQFKIFKSSVDERTDQNPAGYIDTDNKSYLRIKCIDYYLNAIKVQLEGKQKMTIRDFLNGYTINAQK